MAILTGNTTTIELQPFGLMPVYNEMILVLDSDNKAMEKFKWLVDIKIDGTVVSRVSVSPNPDGYGVLDIHRHIESSVSQDNPMSDGLEGATFITPAPLSYANWDIDVYEVLSGWFFDDNYFVSGSDLGFTGSTPQEHYFESGDTIFVTQDEPIVFDEYNGIKTVAGVPDVFSIETTFGPFSAGTAVSGFIRWNDNRVVNILQDSSGISFFKTAFNGAISFKDVLSWANGFDYQLDSTGFLGDGNFLTTIPRGMTVRDTDKFWINAYTPDSFVFDGIGIITYDASGSIEGVYGVDNPYSTPTDAEYILQIGAGPWNLAQIPTSAVTVAIGALPIIKSTTARYAFHAFDTLTATTSEDISFYIESDNCSKYENIQLLYLDKLGSWQMINFDKVSRKNVSNQRTDYKQNWGEYNGSSWGYNTWDRGNTTLDIISTENQVINSDWVLENTTGLQIIEMLSSPEVFIYDEDGDLIAITILTTSFEKKKKINDKMINYTISFKQAFNNINQRG